LLTHAVREYGRVLQTGVQQRSTPHFAEARERFFDSGLIGEVHMVRTIWNCNGGYLMKPPAGMEKKPEGLDWEACLGRAAMDQAPLAPPQGCTFYRKFISGAAISRSVVPPTPKPSVFTPSA
jgi:hypothetical protein